MRVILISVYIFINLLMFGMCGYIYIVWSHYWKNRNRYLYPPNTVKPVKHQEKHTLVDYFEENITATPATVENLNFAPTFPNATQYGANYLADRRMLLEFKRKIIIKLRSVLLEESTLTRHQKENPYDVAFVEPMHNHDRSPQALLCELRKIMGERLRQLRPEDVEEPQLRQALTRRLLFEEGEHYEKCAIVSNAGALRHSYLGAEIDKHDLVLRFNHAPTQDYEVDVGSKTTIRIVNSQVASKPEFDFTNSALYKNIKILIWDPMPFRGTIKFWLQNPEHNFFPSFIQYKRQHPESNVAIVNPEELWKLWAYLQQHTFSKMRLNPPSSGFLGLALLLPHCSSVSMFEFVPSHRMTSTCHYFAALIDPTCTTGVWHPLAAEKLLQLSLNTASDETVFNKGYVTIAGYSKLKC